MLYDRTASLVIGKPNGKAVEIRDLRFSFSIEKGAGENPNKCTCEVYNMNPATRAMVETVNNVLILKAGYKNAVGEIVIFAGTVTRAMTVKQGADWVTSLQLSDGGLEYRDKKTSFSFAPGAKSQAVLSKIAAAFGLPVRPLPADIAQKQYPDGCAFVGRAREAMTKACEYLGLEWSIQNREIQILKKGGTVKMQAFVLSANTGLIGSPESDSKTLNDKAASKTLEVQGYKVKTLLQPTIQPGGFVRLESVSIKPGFFRVEAVTHEGDTHADPWYSQLILRFV